MTTPEKYAQIVTKIREVRNQERNDPTVNSRLLWSGVYGLIYRTLYDLDPEAFKKDIENSILDAEGP